MKKVFIISAARTPLGSFGGTLSSIPATHLGATAIKAVVAKIPSLTTAAIDEVFMGNVCSANLGQAPARQAAIFANLPKNVCCTTVNKVCASGMKSAMLGAQSIILGDSGIVVAGGMENMSQIPYYIPNARYGYKYGNGEIIDGLAKDGLTDVYGQMPMGVCADNTAARYKISREAQDEFAINSYKRAAEATAKGYFADEIVGVAIPQKKGEPLVISEDEEYKKVMFDKIPSLRPAFTKDGTVTAANASTINDGAAAMVLANEDAIAKYDIKPIAQIISFADAEQEPEWFTTTPILAAQKALDKANLKITDIDYFEVNEAFAVVPMAFAQEFKISYDKINVFGGAVAIGHPLGASGSRIMVTLINVLHQKKAKYGLAAICNGGGGASAVIIKRM
ncbi:MAG: thiolase family protein [Saprospiraceae bacterium]|nr:thiolase family protein [Saprospiraceae bacterium]MBP7699375.1 thiolase family protein [Saprospiraceae bacterium]